MKFEHYLVHINVQQKLRLAEALLACANMTSRAVRDTIVADLPFEVKTGIRRHDSDRVDVVNIVTTVVQYCKFAELMTIVRLYEGSSQGIISVEQAYLQTLLACIISAANLPLRDLVVAYRKVLGTRKSVVDSITSIDEILTDLWDLPRQANGHYPPFVFVEWLAINAPAIAEDLRAWIDDATQFVHQDLTAADIAQMRTDIATAAITPTNYPSYLLVELLPDFIAERNDGPQQYKVEIVFWRHDGKERKWRAGDEPAVLLAQVPEVLNQVLEENVAAWGGNPLWLEFFLPSDLLSHEIDHWENKAVSTQGARFGMDYPLVIRSLRRLRNRALWANWWTKWQQFQRQGQTQPITQLFWLYAHDEYEPLALRSRLITEETASCLGMAFAPTPQADDKPDPVFNPLLDAGIPVALWPRHCQHTTKSAAEVQTMLKQLCDNRPLRDLPEIIRLARLRSVDPQESDFGKHLTLFWDDPTRIPCKYRSDAQLREPQVQS